MSCMKVRCLSKWDDYIWIKLILHVLSQEEDAESEGDDEEPEDMFVNALLEELSALRSAVSSTSH